MPRGTLGNGEAILVCLRAGAGVRVSENREVDPPGRTTADAAERNRHSTGRGQGLLGHRRAGRKQGPALSLNANRSSLAHSSPGGSTRPGVWADAASSVLLFKEREAARPPHANHAGGPSLNTLSLRRGSEKTLHVSRCPWLSPMYEGDAITI